MIAPPAGGSGGGAGGSGGGFDFMSMFGNSGGGSSGGSGGKSSNFSNTGNIPYVSQLLPLIRSGFDTTSGLIQMGLGASLRKKSDAMAPPATDSGQMAVLAMLKAKASSFGSGTGFSVEKGLIGQQAAATRSAISENSGGDASATISGLLKSQQAANTGLNQVIANEAQREQFYTSAMVQQQNLVSQRKLELQLLKQSRISARAAALTQSGSSSFTSGIKMS